MPKSINQVVVSDFVSKVIGKRSIEKKYRYVLGDSKNIYSKEKMEDNENSNFLFNESNIHSNNLNIEVVCFIHNQMIHI